MAIKPIEILINAKDNASGVFNSLKGTVATVGAAIAAYFGINAFAGIVKGAADLEQGMSRVQAATGATADEMAALRKAAEDAGANTKYTATEAAAALENLAKAGLSSSEAVAALPAVLNLAAAGDIELATSAEFVTKAVMGMGLAFEDAGRVADVLALGANATNTSVTGLAQALSYAAPVAQSLGLSLESTVAIIGKFADAGIDASRAGTALNSILSQFSNPASKFREELAAAGITTNNFEEALAQLAAAGPRGSKAIIAVGQEAGPALRALLNQGIGALSDLTARLKDAEGSAAATAKVMQDNLNGAFSGLSSAWETVKNTLGTPVLPVLTQGVNELATAFRSAVADGTVGRFGESIATAFKNGLQFVRDFVSQIDFGAVLARMQAFADGANDVFTKVGEYATNAGNTLKIAFGAIQTSGNAMLAGLYGAAAGLTLIIQGLIKGIEYLYVAASKVTFGGLSEQYKQIAAELKIQSDGMGAAVDALGERIRDSLSGAGKGLSNMVDGFGGLAGAARDAAPAVAKTSAALGEAAKQLDTTAEKTAKAKAATEAKAKADADAALAIQNLKADYQAFVEAGDLQRAAEAFVRLEAAQRATINSGADAAKAAQDTADQVDAAFARLGVTSAAVLKQQADAAVRDYKTIKDSGLATAEDIQGAFIVAAEKAISANKGIAPSWVAAEAAARGLRLEADSAGQVIVRRMSEAAGATRKTGDAATSAADGYTALAGSANAAANAVEKLRNLQRGGGGAGGGGGGGGGANPYAQFTDKQLADYYQQYGRFSAPGKDGANDEIDRRDREARLSGNGPAVDSSGMFAALSKLEANALTKDDIPLIKGVLESIRGGELGNAALVGLRSLDGQDDTQKWSQVGARLRQQLDALEAAAGPMGAAQGGSSQAVGGVIVNLNYNGAAIGPVVTDERGRQSIEDFMAALTDGKGRS